MSLPEAWHALLHAGAYPHPCGAIDVVETHISWVLLTGDFAYKMKRPVRFSFVDFSTLERRHHFCLEELRCNRRFAPTLYLDVVPVVRQADGRLQVGGDGEVVEWAVKMRQFPAQSQLDRLLEAGAVDGAMLAAFGRSLAQQHRALPVRRLDVAELEARVLAPARENFDDLDALHWTAPHRSLLERCRQSSGRQAERQRRTLARRLEDGWIRECHGDLHLSNLVLLETGVAAFDCLEFNANLRWIDTQSDVAFLFMDCLVRDRPDLGYAFLDGYLDESGDYDGARVLPFYAAYRSMVRAKVAALRREQAEPEGVAALEQRCLQHCRWAAAWLERPPGKLVLTCGLSGSGKSFLAERLAPRMPAVRLRSDVARKAAAGLPSHAAAGSAPGQGLYTDAKTAAVYRGLADLAKDLLTSGEHVIVDATFLEPDRRRPFLALAERLGSTATIVYCDAPARVLEQRIRERVRAGGDASDADLTVLAHQRAVFEIPRGDTVRVDTAAPLDDAALTALAATLAGG